jgi:hypothetical protein
MEAAALWDIGALTEPYVVGLPLRGGGVSGNQTR